MIRIWQNWGEIWTNFIRFARSCTLKNIRSSTAMHLKLNGVNQKLRKQFAWNLVKQPVIGGNLVETPSHPPTTVLGEDNATYLECYNVFNFLKETICQQRGLEV